MTNMFEMSGPYLEAMPLKEALRAYLSVGIEWGNTGIGLVRFFGRAAYQGDPNLAERVVRPVAEKMRQVVSGLLEKAVERGEIPSTEGPGGVYPPGERLDDRGGG